MSHFFSGVSRMLPHRWLYGLMAAIMTTSLIVLTPTVSQAQSIFDLIFRGVQILQLANLSDRQEVALGRQMNDQLMGQQFRRYRNSQVNDYVDEIGQRLVPYSSRPVIPYVFQVVEDDCVNAFATLGGYVYVTTGLIQTAENEAQLAGVVGHEIGHITERHVVDRMTDQAIQRGIATAAGVDRNAAIAIGIELAINRPNSRDDEYEADEEGLIAMTQAGYAPIGIVDFLEKLRGQSSVPTFLSTHPAAGNRIERLRQMIDPAAANVGDGLDQNAYRRRIQPLL